MSVNRVSHSQYSVWSNCPYQWKLKYIDKLAPFSDSIHTMFGTSVHEVLQTYLDVMYKKSIKEADQLPLDKMLLHRMKTNYENIMKNNGGEEFCTENDMKEFFSHGVLIFDFFKKKRANYFSKKYWELVGVEIPLQKKLRPNMNFVGFIDLVMKDTRNGRFKVIDIKTSTKGWNKYVKQDKIKSDQILLYKKFLSETWKIPIDRIDVEFLILKRMLYENVDFPQKRVQLHHPANGTPSMNQTWKRFESFIDDCYDENGDIILDKEYTKTNTQKSCKWCEFKDKPEICDRG